MRAPLDGKIRVTPHGAYGFVRTKENAPGLCSSGKYPCTHKGVDLAAAGGTIVKAPERGIVIVAANRNDLKPFSRYGPAFVYMKGLETGVYHLLAHLKAGSIKTAGGGFPLGPGAREEDNATILVLGTPYPVAEGQYLGVVDPGKKHLHWEVNPGDRWESPETVRDGWRRVRAHDIRGRLTLDPLKLLKGVYEEGNFTDEESGSGWLLLLGLFLLARKR